MTQKTLLELQKQQELEKKAFCDAITTMKQAQDKKFEMLTHKVENDFHQEQQFISTVQEQLSNYLQLRETTKLKMLHEIESAKAAAVEALQTMRHRGGAAFNANKTEIDDVRLQTETSTTELKQHIADAQVSLY